MTASDNGGQGPTLGYCVIMKDKVSAQLRAETPGLGCYNPAPASTGSQHSTITTNTTRNGAEEPRSIMTIQLGDYHGLQLNI